MLRWKIGSIFIFLFCLFNVSLIIVTLLLVSGIRDDNINDTFVAYVEVGNWIYVSVYMMFLLIVVVTSPFVYKNMLFPKTVNNLGLHHAHVSSK